MGREVTLKCIPRPFGGSVYWGIRLKKKSKIKSGGAGVGVGGDDSSIQSALGPHLGPLRVSDSNIKIKNWEGR